MARSTTSTGDLLPPRHPVRLLFMLLTTRTPAPLWALFFFLDDGTLVQGRAAASSTGFFLPRAAPAPAGPDPPVGGELTLTVQLQYAEDDHMLDHDAAPQQHPARPRAEPPAPRTEEDRRRSVKLRRPSCGLCYGVISFSDFSVARDLMRRGPSASNHSVSSCVPPSTSLVHKVLTAQRRIGIPVCPQGHYLHVGCLAKLCREDYANCQECRSEFPPELIVAGLAEADLGTWCRSAFFYCNLAARAWEIHSEADARAKPACKLSPEVRQRLRSTIARGYRSECAKLQKYAKQCLALSWVVRSSPHGATCDINRPTGNYNDTEDLHVEDQTPTSHDPSSSGASQISSSGASHDPSSSGASSSGASPLKRGVLSDSEELPATSCSMSSGFSSTSSSRSSSSIGTAFYSARSRVGSEEPPFDIAVRWLETALSFDAAVDPKAWLRLGEEHRQAERGIRLKTLEEEGEEADRRRRRRRGRRVVLLRRRLRSTRQRGILVAGLRFSEEACYETALWMVTSVGARQEMTEQAKNDVVVKALLNLALKQGGHVRGQWRNRRQCVEEALSLDDRCVEAWQLLASMRGGWFSGSWCSPRQCHERSLTLGAPLASAWRVLAACGGGTVHGHEYSGEECLKQACSFDELGTFEWYRALEPHLRAIGLVGRGQLNVWLRETKEEGQTAVGEGKARSRRTRELEVFRSRSQSLPKDFSPGVFETRSDRSSSWSSSDGWDGRFSESEEEGAGMATVVSEGGETGDGAGFLAPPARIVGGNAPSAVHDVGEQEDVDSRVANYIQPGVHQIQLELPPPVELLHSDSEDSSVSQD